MLEAMFSKPRLIFGCGNPLFGDDGFGPEVIRTLDADYKLPQDAACLDVGTAIRDFLFDILLLERKPSQIIIVDAMDLPHAILGEIREIDIGQIRPEKIGDFSLHQFPTTNMLKEISEETQIDVSVLVVKVAGLPGEVRPGLSEPIRQAIAPMCERILSKVGSTLSGQRKP